MDRNTRKGTRNMKKSDALAKALAEALAEEERIEQKFGGDQEDGAVIAFKVRFFKGGVNYDHAALRSQGLWYTTGPKSPKGFTWQELVSWLDAKHRVSKITVLRGGKAKKNAKQRVARAQHPAVGASFDPGNLFVELFSAGEPGLHTVERRSFGGPDHV